MSSDYPVKVLATTQSRGLANEVCEVLAQKIPHSMLPEGGKLFTKPTVDRFSNENLQVQVPNLRGHMAVVIHTQTPPANEQVIELFALLDAIKGAHPADVFLVFPYMPYARSDIKNQPRISVMSQWLAETINRVSGVKRVLLMDSHGSHVKHYFDPTADEISAVFLIIDHLKNHFLAQHSPGDVAMVFPDAGAAKRFERVAQLLSLKQGYIHKVRRDNKEKPKVEGVVGEVKEKTCLLIDDEILTGGTVEEDAAALIKAGARSVVMVAIHPILQKAEKLEKYVVDKLEESPVDQFIITDSIPVRHKLGGTTKFTVLSIAGLLAEAISRSIQNASLTALYDPENVKLYRL